MIEYYENRCTETNFNCAKIKKTIQDTQAKEDNCINMIRDKSKLLTKMIHKEEIPAEATKSPRCSQTGLGYAYHET